MAATAPAIRYTIPDTRKEGEKGKRLEFTDKVCGSGLSEGRSTWMFVKAPR